MGIAFVLIGYAIVGLVLAGIGALALGFAATFLTRGAHGSRKRLIVVASFFPFICFGWAGAAFVFQAVINEFVFHRDPGFGDSWNCPLPNGYAILMIDITDQGDVYNPRTQPDSVSEGNDAITGVRKLQVAGRYILGGSDTRAYEQSSNDSTHVDSYFLLDTQLGQHTNFSSYEALQTKAHELGLSLNLEPIATIYSRYRFTWFDVFAIVLWLAPSLAGFVFLARWTFRVRKTRAALLPS